MASDLAGYQAEAIEIGALFNRRVASLGIRQIRASVVVQSHVQKLVKANAGHVIGLESIGPQGLSGDVEVPFERRYCPTALSFRDQIVGFPMADLHGPASWEARPGAKRFSIT